MLHQDEAKKAFQSGIFSEALSSYQEALTLFTRTTSEVESQQQQHRQQRSILLSNIVACRLKMGASGTPGGSSSGSGGENLSAALEEALECVLLHDKWPKAHVRLAAVYIALGNHSNDACQALQTALRLDPLNTCARSMLIRELRRNSGVPTSSSRENDCTSSISHHDEYEDVDDPCYHNSNSSSGNNSNSINNTDRCSNRRTMTRNVFFITWVNSMTFEQYHRFVSWYSNCTENAKQRLHMSALLTILYISFGGRFGMYYITEHIRSFISSSWSTTSTATSTAHHLGNYGKDNAYERFYKEKSKYSFYHYNEDTDNSRSFHDSYNQHGQRDHYHQYHHDGTDFYSIFVLVMMLGTIYLLTQMQRQVLRGGVPGAMPQPPGMGFGFGRHHGRWMGRGGVGGGFGGGGFGHLYIGGFHIPLDLGRRMNRFHRPAR